ncbi:MAG: toprim domain-containing protein [Alphaproteobacteria bacterium]|nr:toprim domain-containing protein [Alphaproteobacteria bacterium]
MANFEVIGRLLELGITLEKSGKQICPQCSASRKNKSDRCLSVSFEQDAVLYYCHHCGWTGAVPYEESKYKKKYNRPAGFKTKEDKTKLIEYFKKRGISAETLEKYNISTDDENHIIFPYYKNGILVNVKTRTNLGNGKKTFNQTKDAEKTFFGMDFVKGLKDLIIVEGEMDVLALAEQGIYAVSVPQGGSDTKLECLANCSNEFLKSFENYIIAVDNDEVGSKLKEHLLNRVPKDKCKIVQWGQYKDANEALIGGADLHNYIDKAEYVQTDGLIDFEKSWDELYMGLFEEDQNFYETGWADFDKLVKIRTGHLMIITGYPSRGKSTFVDNLLINLAKRYPDKMKHLIASFENTISGYYKTLYEMYTEQPFWHVTNEPKEQAMEKVLFGPDFEFISEHFKMFDNSRLWDIDKICERTEIEVMKHGIKTLVIDPYNRLDNKYTDREDKYVGSILAKLCMLAKKLDILVIFVAHPKKPDTETMPSMYSISGSGDWYNMADYGIIVHRERDAVTRELLNQPQICVAKIKNFSLGNPSGGTITLNYNANKRILENKGG